MNIMSKLVQSVVPCELGSSRTAIQRGHAVLKRCPRRIFQNTSNVIPLDMHPDRSQVLASLHVLCMGRVPRSASSKSPQCHRPTLKLCVGAVLGRSSAAMLAAATPPLQLSYILPSMGSGVPARLPVHLACPANAGNATSTCQTHRSPTVSNIQGGLSQLDIALRAAITKTRACGGRCTASRERKLQRCAHPDAQHST